MEVIEYVEKIDNIMSSVNKDYKYIYDDIHNYLNNGKITYNELMDFEVSLEDLSIQLNSLVFLFKQTQVQDIILENSMNNINTQDNSYEHFNNKEKIKQYNKEIKDNKMDNKIDYIIDKTIFNIMPLIFFYFMIVDKESILYLKDFVESKNNIYNTSNTSNTSNNIKKEEYNNKCKNIINSIFNEEYILNDLD